MATDSMSRGCFVLRLHCVHFNTPRLPPPDDQPNSHNAGLSYNLPWGWWNFTYSYNRSTYRDLTQANGFDFKQNGDSATHQFKAERVVYRDALSKTSLSMGLSYLATGRWLGCQAGYQLQ